MVQNGSKFNYTRIRELNPLIDTVRSAHDKMLEEKRAEVLETVRQCMEATHTAANGDSKVSHLIEKSDRYFSQCKEKIAELKSLALLDAMFLPMCQYKDDTVSNIESVLEPPAPKPQVQPTQQGKEQATAKKKENKFVAFVKNNKVLSTIVGLILLFVLSLGTTLGIANATRTKDVAIPNLVGKTVDEAKKLVQDSKLVYSEGEAEYSADVEAGKIISQNPKYTQNGTVKEKSEIKVIVSLGTEKTKVPKFVGTTKEEAEKSAKDAKLKLEFVEETSKTIESGYITKQETDEGTEVNAGDTVKVYISIGTGIKQVVVTSVLQKDVETAKKSLEEKGLVVEIEYTEDKTKDNGVVLNQSIKSGETVDEGSTITLTVNKIAETKTGTVTINVKSITGYQDKIKKPVTESVKGETTSTTIQKEVEVDNTPNTIQLKVTVDGETVTDEKVKENVTDKQVSVSGKGNVTIKVYIDGILKKTVDMNLNNTDKLTIE